MRWRSAIVLREFQRYVPVPLWCFKCQKCGHLWEAYTGRQTCAQCGEKVPDHLEEDFLKQICCANCWQDHPAYVRSCDINKKEKEILEMKHKRNVSFLEARKIVGPNIEENSHASVVGYYLWRQQIENSRGEIDPVGNEWLAKVSEAPEKN